MELMGKENSISYDVDNDGILTIKIDTNKEIGPSASGVGNGRAVKIGLNLYY